MGFLRTLAGILLLVSILTLVPIGRAVIRIINGGHVEPLALAVPLAIMGIAAFLTWLLTRKQVSLPLYLAAFALWLITAGYYFLRFVV